MKVKKIYSIECTQETNIASRRIHGSTVENALKIEINLIKGEIYIVGFSIKKKLTNASSKYIYGGLFTFVTMSGVPRKESNTLKALEPPYGENRSGISIGKINFRTGEHDN